MDYQLSFMDYLRRMTIPDIASIIFPLITGLVCLTGIILAIVLRKRHSFVSIITIVALLLMAINVVTIPGLRFYTIETRDFNIRNDKTEDTGIEKRNGNLTEEDKDRFYHERMRKAAENFRYIPPVFNALESLIQLLVFILLLMAIFLGRAPNVIRSQ